MIEGYMNQEGFRAHVRRLFVKPEDSIGKMLHAAVGISGESGEILDALKKTWIYGKPLDDENILEECGDVLFYLVALLDENGLTLQDAALHNIGKLALRYPTGAYTDAHAIARLDKDAS